MEHSAGQTAFLSLILVFIKPPGEATIVFLAQSLLASVALAVTWAWCVLGTKLAVLARDHERDLRIANATNGSVLRHNPNATMTDLEGMGIKSISIRRSNYARSSLGRLVESVFEGAFLQAGPSAIWGVFLFIGIYGIFLIRAYQVRLFFVMVFCVCISFHVMWFSPGHWLIV